MRHIAPRIAVLLILSLLAQSSPSFAQHTPTPRASMSPHDTSQGSTYQTVDVMTPSQFVDPPPVARHTYIAAGTAYGIIVGTLYVIAKLFVPFT
jgi:hypothetical protein